MKSLLKDVSRDELLRMRRAGMTNMDIAKSLGVSYPTVYRHIGAQPSRGGKMAAFVPEPTPPRAAPADDAPAALVVTGRVVNLMGEAAEYRFDAGARSVTVRPAGAESEITVPFDALPLMIAELQAIARQLDRQALTAEMW